MELLDHLTVLLQLLSSGNFGDRVVATLNEGIPVSVGQTVEERFLLEMGVAPEAHQLIILTPPTLGVLAISNAGTPNDIADDTFTYTPPANFQGVQQFSYYVIRESDWAVSEVRTVDLLVGEQLAAGTYHEIAGTLSDSSPERHFFIEAAPGSFGEDLTIFEWDEEVNWVLTGPDSVYESSQTTDDFAYVYYQGAAEGWYHLVATRKNPTGSASYDFYIEFLPAVDELPAALGQMLTGQLEVYSQTDHVAAHRYRFNATASERFVLTAMAEKAPSRVTPTDIQIVVTDASGTHIRLAQSPGATATGLSYSHVFEAPSDGPFYVTMHSPRWRGGSYQLYVEEVGPLDEAVLDASTAVLLSGGLDHAAFTLNLQRAQRVVYRPTGAFSSGTQWKLVRLDGPGYGAEIEDGHFLPQAVAYEGNAADLAEFDIVDDGTYVMLFTNPLLGSGQQATGSFEVEVESFDFGDAPDLAIPAIIYANLFPTKITSGGAAHRIVPGIHLGTNIDRDRDGLSNLDATGDDKTAQADDDGVRVTSRFVPGGAAGLEVTASTSGLLNAWIDFNNDGDWDDAGEHVFVDRALTAGANALTVSVPTDAQVNPGSFARFRFSTEAGLGYGGFATDGEVEDYALAVGAAGDFNFDGHIDGSDFLRWQRAIGAVVSPTGSGADGDASGFVDDGDLTKWKDDFGQPSPPSEQSLVTVAAPSSTLAVTSFTVQTESDALLLSTFPANAWCEYPESRHSPLSRSTSRPSVSTVESSRLRMARSIAIDELASEPVWHWRPAADNLRNFADAENGIANLGEDALAELWDEFLPWCNNQ